MQMRTYCTDAFKQISNERNKPALLRGVKKPNYTVSQKKFPPLNFL